MAGWLVDWVIFNADDNDGGGGGGVVYVQY